MAQHRRMEHTGVMTRSQRRRLMSAQQHEAQPVQPQPMIMEPVQPQMVGMEPMSMGTRTGMGEVNVDMGMHVAAQEVVASEEMMVEEEGEEPQQQQQPEDSPTQHDGYEEQPREQESLMLPPVPGDGDGGGVECQFERASAWINRLKRGAGFASDVLTNTGLSLQCIEEKIDMKILDPLHMRSLVRYIRSIIQMSQDMSQQQHTHSGAPPPPPVPLPPPVGGAPPPAVGAAAQQKRSYQQHPKVPCPIMKMGYASVECKETMKRCHVLDHLAGHVATLMKRVQELEMEVRDLRSMCINAPLPSGGGGAPSHPVISLDDD